jgi:hypothetical protein
MKYILTNEEQGFAPEEVEFDEAKASEEALDYVGFRLEPKVSDDDHKVRQFFLIENETGNEIWNFFDYYYENACLTALTELGYTLFEDEEAFAFEL